MSDEQVLVIPRNIVFGENDEGAFQGFNPIAADYINLFTQDNLLYRPRSLVETETQYKQIIPYLIFKQGNKILGYQRTKKGGEGRLHSKWSIGFGGHMNDGDEDFAAAIFRERAEELDFDWDSQIGEVFGLINDDSNEVGKVHLGLVYLTSIEKGTPKPTKDEGLSNIGWYSPEELLSYELENWSKIVLTALHQ